MSSHSNVDIVLFDGDVVAYLACESRVRGKSILDIIKEEYRDELLKQLEIHGDTLKLLSLGDIQFTPEQDVAYFEKAWANFNRIINETMEFFFADNKRIAVKGDGNFRDDIYPDYKANRRVVPEKRNNFVPMLRERAVREGLAVPAHAKEADDLIRMWHTELCDTHEIVIAGGDKDFKCMHGRHYTLKTRTLFSVTKPEATKFFYSQLLQGDPTDNIKGVPKVGPKKADALLEPLTEETEYQELAVRAYYQAYGPRWKEELTLNGRLVYLLKAEDDIFSIDKWPAVDLDAVNAISEAVQKVVKVDTPLTIETALAVVDPTSVVGSNAWNKAMEFLMTSTQKLSETKEEQALDALEVLTTRGKIPASETIAFNALKGFFTGIGPYEPVKPASTLPLSFQKVEMPEAPKVPVIPAVGLPKFTLPAKTTTVQAPVTPPAVPFKFGAKPAEAKVSVPAPVVVPQGPPKTPAAASVATPTITAVKPSFVFKAPEKK